jgi:hypothetical protein
MPNNFKAKNYGKRKVNYQEVYDLYQLCSEVKELKEFCSEMGVNYDKFMNWQRHQLWDAKLGKTVAKEQPQSAPVKIVGTPSNQSMVKIEPVKPSAPEPIRWVKVQLADGANLFLRNTNVLNLSLTLNKLIG